MSGLEAEARAWAEEHADEAPPPAAPPAPAAAPTAEEPPTQSSPPAREAAAEKEEPSESALGMEEIAEIGVTAIDFGLQNFVSPRCAFKAEQKAELSRLGAKVLEKYLPALDGAIEPEYAFVGAVAMFAFMNYRSSAPPPKSNASPAGGGEAPKGGAEVPTEASVDGRPVEARVMQ